MRGATMAAVGGRPAAAIDLAGTSRAVWAYASGLRPPFLACLNPSMCRPTEDTSDCGAPCGRGNLGKVEGASGGGGNEHRCVPRAERAGLSKTYQEGRT